MSGSSRETSPPRREGVRALGGSSRVTSPPRGAGVRALWGQFSCDITVVYRQAPMMDMFLSLSTFIPNLTTQLLVFLLLMFGNSKLNN